MNAGELDYETLSMIGEYNLQLEELKHTFGSLTQEQKKVIFEFMLPGKYIRLK